jgi:hypothetical protein
MNGTGYNVIELLKKLTGQSYVRKNTDDKSDIR